MEKPNLLCLTGLLAEIDSFYYGTGHPMKPHRISLAQNLISSYHLYQKLIVHVSLLLDCFHSFLISLVSLELERNDELFQLFFSEIASAQGESRRDLPVPQ